MSNYISTIHLNNTDYDIKDAEARAVLAEKENVNNKTTAVRNVSSASDTLYPTEKAVASAISSSTGAEWGAIAGTLSNQTDLNTALNQKESTSNKTTTVRGASSASDTLYPTEKAVASAISSSTGAEWGAITGTLANQTDLNTALSSKIAATEKGASGGVAELNSDGKVPATQLPSYVDDVLEYASQSQFPATGETGKIYIAQDTNKTYRWSGTAYVEISASLALGETSSTAYRGDRGKTAYDHSQATGNPHGTTAAQITGLGSLATKNSASGSFTPAGIIDIDPETETVNSITDVGSLPTHAADSFSAGTLPSYVQGSFATGTLPTWSALVTNEVLSFSFSQGTLPSHSEDSFTQGSLPAFTQGTFTQGSLPTKGVNQSVLKSVSASFDGDEGTVTVS